MPTYTIPAPDGHTYSIDGPDGATDEQVHAEVLRQFPQAAGTPAAPDAKAPSSIYNDQSRAVERTPIPDAMQAESNAWLARNDPRTNPQGYTAMRVGLDKKYGLRSDPDAYLSFAKGLKPGQHLSVIPDPAKFNQNDQGIIDKALVDPQGNKAVARGAADFVGGAGEVGAAVDSLVPQQGRENVWNSDRSISDIWSRNHDIDEAVLSGDEENHPVFRGIGQLLGNLALPVGMEGVAFNAGRDALRAGATIREARAVAATAARNRMASIGTAQGGSAGFLGSDGDVGHRLANAGVGALEGAAVAGATGQAAKVAEPWFTAREGARRALPAVTTARDAAGIAADLNIPSTPATVGGGMAHAVQMGLGNLPGGMTAVAKGVERENTGVSNAVSNIADSIGQVTTREGAGQAAVDGAKDYSKTSKAEGAALYNERDRLLGGDNAPVTLDETQKQIADIADKYPTSQTLAALMQHPVIRKLAAITGDAAQGDGLPPELTLSEATDALSHVRGVDRALNRSGADSDQIMARVGNVKQALTNDVLRAAAAADQAAGREAGSPGSAVAAQKQADAFWADRKTALGGTLKAAMTAGAKPTEMPAERVYSQIDGDTLRVGGNLARLRDTWFRLPEQARNTIAATKMDDMGRSLPGQQNSAGDAWSFDRFLTNYDRMTPQARNIMFGTRATEQLADVAAYSSRLRDLSKSRNFSNTAKNYISGALLTTVGAALWHGAPMEAAAAAASIPASYAAATLFLKTPAMRAWTQAALKTAMVRDPVKAQAAGDVLLKRLSLVAKTEPLIANDVLGLQRKLSDAFAASPAKLAAEQNPKKDTGVDGNSVDAQQ